MTAREIVENKRHNARVSQDNEAELERLRVETTRANIEASYA